MSETDNNALQEKIMQLGQETKEAEVAGGEDTVLAQLANGAIEPNQFFEDIKGKSQSISLPLLKNKVEKALEISISARKTSQSSLYISSVCLGRIIYKEVFAAISGYERFVKRLDIDTFINKVTPKDSIRICELKDYPRQIPLDVVEKYELAKKFGFDHFYVLYTDYTDPKDGNEKFVTPEEKKVQNKNRDPILFGCFSSTFKYFSSSEKREMTIEQLSDNLFFIADWIDDYCDLTFSKMLDKMAEIGMKEQVNKNTTVYSHTGKDSQLEEMRKKAELFAYIHKSLKQEKDKGKALQKISSLPQFKDYKEEILSLAEQFDQIEEEEASFDKLTNRPRSLLQRTLSFFKK